VFLALALLAGSATLAWGLTLDAKGSGYGKGEVITVACPDVKVTDAVEDGIKYYYTFKGPCILPDGLTLVQVTATATVTWYSTGAEVKESVEATAFFGKYAINSALSKCDKDPFIHAGATCKVDAVNTNLKEVWAQFPLMRGQVPAGMAMKKKESAPPPPPPPAPAKAGLVGQIISPTEDQVIPAGAEFFLLTLEPAVKDYPPKWVGMVWERREGGQWVKASGPFEKHWAQFPLEIHLKPNFPPGRYRVRAAGLPVKQETDFTDWRHFWIGQPLVVDIPGGLKGLPGLGPAQKEKVDLSKVDLSKISNLEILCKILDCSSPAPPGRGLSQEQQLLLSKALAEKFPGSAGLCPSPKIEVGPKWITPGGEFFINGCGFKSKQGKVVVSSPHFGALEAGKYAWAPTIILFELPGGAVTGVHDHQVSIQVITYDSMASNTLPTEFYAEKELLTMPYTDLQVFCSANADLQNTCGQAKEGSWSGIHVLEVACKGVSPCAGQDSVSVTLGNGWVLWGAEYYGPVASLEGCTAGVDKKSVNFPPGGPSFTVTVPWVIPCAPGAAMYVVNIVIRGPKGVPYK